MTKQILALLWSIGLLSIFACLAIQPGLEDTAIPTPPDEPTAVNSPLPPPSDPLFTPVSIPIPDFAESIIFFGYGGGPGGACHFDLPPAPSVVGGTTYFVKPVSEPVNISEGLFPRGAQLCMAGLPEEQPIHIKLISPDHKVTLNAEIRVITNPLEDIFLNVFWSGYPENWSIGEGEHWLASGGYRFNQDAPSEVILELWWAGSLAKGIWQAEVSWSGQSIHGEFEANTRNLPEVSLYDPRFESLIIPSIDASDPFNCHLANDIGPYQVIAENFPPNSLIYILVYSIPELPEMNGEKASLYYQTSIASDEEGFAIAQLPLEVATENLYYILGVPEGVSTVTWNDGSIDNAFSFAKIANAMDCFVAP